jgi:hypothetical protein
MVLVVRRDASAGASPSKCEHRERLLFFRRLALQLDEDEVNRTLPDVFRQMRMKWEGFGSW